MPVHVSPIDRIYQYLFITSFFFLPLTVLGNNLAIWLLAIVWFCSGDYVQKFWLIAGNKLALSSIVFFCVHIVALLWTEHLWWGLEILRKMLPFLIILPILLTISRRENVKYYVGAFLLGISISEGLSYAVWFGLIEPFGHATSLNPTPLMSHISYNPFLAFSIYLVLNHLLSTNKLSQLERAIFTFFALTMSFNMFITGGRAGQVMFFVSLVVLAFQHFRNSQIKAIITSMFLIVLISLLAYNTSSLFQQRVDSFSHDIVNYEQNKNTAVGQRITFLINSYELFKKSPFIGVGTGDFPSEYEEVSSTLSPEVDLTVQPHNMYMLILVQLGLVGLISFLYIFYLQFKIAINSKDQFVYHVGVAMPILFLTIMWSDSYLLGHFTGNLFIMFGSFIYSER